MSKDLNVSRGSLSILAGKRTRQRSRFKNNPLCRRNDMLIWAKTTVDKLTHGNG